MLTSQKTYLGYQTSVVREGGLNISGDPQVGGVLTAKNATAVQWMAAGVDISGQTALTYTVLVGDVGKQITARSTSGTIETSNALTALAAITAPTTILPPLILGTPQQGQALSIQAATFNGTSPTVERSIYRIAHPSNFIIAKGALASAMYTLGLNDVGAMFYVVDEATNAAGTVRAVSPRSRFAISGAAPSPAPIASATAKTDTLIEYFAPALTATDSSANAVCLHMQKTLNASAADTASTDAYLLNASKVQVSTCIVAVSYSAVAAGGTAVGSAVSAGNAACLNNAGTWSSTFTVNIPVSTSTQGDNAPGMANIGPQLRAALPPLDRTDFPGGLMIMHVRAYYAVGSSYTLCNYMAGNSVNGASQDYELNKEDPAVSLLGGRLMRCFRAFNVDGVTNKAALTTALALAQPNGGLACFFVQKLSSAKADQAVIEGDSRSTMCKPTLHATAGVHALAHAAVSTQARPIGFCHLGADGWGTPRWKDRATQMTAFFTSIGASASPLVFLPINSINGWGSGPTIAQYAGNATDVESIRQMWVAVGGRVVKETVLGVDPTSPNYQWTDLAAGDVGVRHAGNLSAAAASSFAAPVIDIGTRTEGALAGNNIYNQTNAADGSNWIEATSAIDTTKAHFTYAWANNFYPLYVPFFQA